MPQVPRPLRRLRLCPHRGALVTRWLEDVNGTVIATHVPLETADAVAQAAADEHGTAIFLCTDSGFRVYHPSDRDPERAAKLARTIGGEYLP